MTLVDTRAFRYSIRFWEQMFGKPEEVASSAECLPNFLPATKGALRSFRPRGDCAELKEETARDADVAVRLLRDALGGDPVVALLRWEVPDLIARLEALLAEGTVDVRGTA